MKGLFPQFDTGSDTNFKTIWEEAVFVFDTNVLLNLYRYQATTRDQLLDLLEKLSDRIWVPHHVALEFQRNRLKVIADQNNRFVEVRKAIKKTQDTLQNELNILQLESRHSLIDPAPLINGFQEVANQFLTNLDSAQENQQKLTSPDPLKEKIESLFDGRVGPAPSDQKMVDELYKAADARYANEIPPGYKDTSKDKNGTDGHCHGGITYKRKYGDYVVWNQLLSYAKEKKIDTLIFVTDDSKEDWWWKINADGPKTLGPRPELREEALRIGNITAFHMFSPAGFLSHSKDFLGTRVSPETLEEVRDFSRVRAEKTLRNNRPNEGAIYAEYAVYEWLAKRFPEVSQNSYSFPDFVAKKNGIRFGFEVKSPKSPSFVDRIIGKITSFADIEISEGRLDMVSIVWVASSRKDAIMIQDQLRTNKYPITSDKIRNIIGIIQETDDSEITFLPLSEFALNESDNKAFTIYNFVE